MVQIYYNVSKNAKLTRFLINTNKLFNVELKNKRRDMSLDSTMKNGNKYVLCNFNYLK